MIAPGCVDMVNFSSKKNVPAKYLDQSEKHGKERKFYEWNSAVYLMRTNKEEVRRRRQFLSNCTLIMIKMTFLAYQSYFGVE